MRLRDHLGFARNVVVQATCHGADNRALVDAAVHSDGKARGVATVKRSVTDDELQALHAAGVRGVRFNFVKRLVDFTPKDELMEIAARIQKLGWHVVIYFEAVDLPELWDFFTALPTTVVVDHMGRPDVSKPVDGPEFELFLKFMREHPNVWSKVSCPERLSVTGPKALNGEQAAYQDVVPFARRVVEAVPRPRALGHRLAAPQPEGPHARRRPAGGLHSADRADGARRRSKLLVRQPHASCTGQRRSDMALDKPYLDVPGTTIFDAEQSRKGYWLNQFCMSLMKAENRERFQEGRARLPRRVADDRRAEAGRARARPQPVHPPRAATSTSSPRSAPPTARASSRWPAP